MFINSFFTVQYPNNFSTPYHPKTSRMKPQHFENSGDTKSIILANPFHKETYKNTYTMNEDDIIIRLCSKGIILLMFMRDIYFSYMSGEGYSITG